jgi:fermentation-respiration switch protein FrsA (DUF1100 family)
MRPSRKSGRRPAPRATRRERASRRVDAVIAIAVAGVFSAAGLTDGVLSDALAHTRTGVATRPSHASATASIGAFSHPRMTAATRSLGGWQPYQTAEVKLHLTDPSRTMPTAAGRVPRAFNVIVRYPSLASGQPAHGPFPLIVFGHGFAGTPGVYSLLLDAWTRAGYVVAAPVFPFTSGRHASATDEEDLPNQPGDMSLVITSLTMDSSTSGETLSGLINRRAVAVAGQSDGAITALAVAYDPAVRDRRVRAAIILSGAEDPFAAQFNMPAGGPPLLAVQGTADTSNEPIYTYQFFDQASPPKLLLKLIGAGHLPPYTEPGPDLESVERTTLAFLAWVFKHQQQPLHHLIRAGDAGPATRLIADL